MVRCDGSRHKQQQQQHTQHIHIHTRMHAHASPAHTRTCVGCDADLLIPVQDRARIQHIPKESVGANPGARSLSHKEARVRVKSHFAPVCVRGNAGSTVAGPAHPLPDTSENSRQPHALFPEMLEFRERGGSLMHPPSRAWVRHQFSSSVLPLNSSPFLFRQKKEETATAFKQGQRSTPRPAWRLCQSALRRKACRQISPLHRDTCAHA